MNLPEGRFSERPSFKVVCENCGSLSIKVAAVSTNSADDAIVQCGRCAAARGTLADLHAL